MFQIIAPNEAAQRALQDSEGGFYWSRCAGNWLRKHGLLSHVGRVGEPLSIVLRMAGTGDVPDGPVVFEGPLAPSTAAMLGLVVEEHEAEAVALDPCGPLPPACLPPRLLYSGVEPFGCARLQYPRFTQRRANREKREWADPETFLPEDRRHRRERIKFQTFDLDRSRGDFRPLLTAHTAEPRSDDPASYGTVAATDGRRLVVGVPLFDMFGAVAQMPPMPVAYMSSVHDLDVEWLQDWLAAAIVQLAAESGGSLVRSARWPHGHSWALSLRVDYDRLLTDAELDSYLDLAARHGVRMSWQLLPNRTISRQAERILQAGHEIALHTEAGSLAAFRAEIEFLRCETGVSVAGSSAHGGLDAMGYCGDLRFGWSEALGLEYGEMISHASLTTYRLNRVVDGLPASSSLFCPAPHRGIDFGMKPEQNMLARYRAHDVPNVCAYGGHFLLMHHPDIHQQELALLLDSVDWSGCWHTTVVGAVEWARDLHYGAMVEVGEGNGLQVILPRPLAEDAAIELIGPDGRRMTIVPVGATRVGLQ